MLQFIQLIADFCSALHRNQQTNQSNNRIDCPPIYVGSEATVQKTKFQKLFPIVGRLHDHLGHSTLSGHSAFAFD